jgi:hypothetical protein
VFYTIDRRVVLADSFLRGSPILFDALHAEPEMVREVDRLGIRNLSGASFALRAHAPGATTLAVVAPIARHDPHAVIASDAPGTATGTVAIVPVAREPGAVLAIEPLFTELVARRLVLPVAASASIPRR